MKPYLVFLLAVVMLTLEFYNNSFHIVDQHFFDHFQKDSESLTVGRLARSKREGAFSHGGFLGWNHPANALTVDNRFGGWGYEVPNHPDKFLFQYEALDQPLPIDHYEEYFSMQGGQAFLYHLLGKVTNTTGNRLVGLSQFLNALFTASILCVFLWWVYRRYGIPAALTAFAVLLLSQWLIVFARNMQYVTGLFFLPFVINLWPNQRCRLTFIALLLKCVIAGFDFILPVLLMAVLPVLYNYTPRRLIAISLSAAAAVAMSLFLLLWQLARHYHSWAAAWDYVVSTGERRTMGAATNISLWQLYQIYANGAAVLNIPFQTFLGLTLIATAVGLLRQDGNRTLMIVTWTALLGPFSWFIVFKNHSINHTHMDYIVWYLPFMLFAPVLIAHTTSSFIYWFFNRKFTIR